MAKRVKKVVIEAPAGEGAPLWVITFSDMVALLMCFFITLFSLSTIKKEKFVNVAAALRGYLNRTTLATPVNDVEGKQGFESSFHEYLKRHEADNAAKNENGQGQAGYEGKELRVRKIREGLQITLGDKQLFDVGSAALRTDDPTVRQALDYLAKELVGYRFVIKINGFSSPSEFGRIKDQRIHDLWQLSYERARSVMEYIAHQTKPEFQVTEKRFRLQSCGTNDLIKDANGREIADQNRRVEIIVTEQRVFFEGEDEPLQ